MSTEGVSGPSSNAPEPAAAQGAEGSDGAKSADRTIKSTFSSVEAFRKEEPELFKGMMEGLAMSMIGRMRKHNERMKQLMREGRRQGR